MPTLIVIQALARELINPCQRFLKLPVQALRDVRRYFALPCRNCR